MWFGDLVTMRWWDDLWLNESFASWAEMVSSTEATRWTNGWTGFAQVYKAWAYRQDQLPSTHPIAADIPDIEAVEVNFDGITYAKGAAVLKQLVAYVGRDNFLAGVRDYFGRHAWGNATLADLLEPPWSRRLAATSRPGPSPGWRRPGSIRCGRRSSWTATAGSAPSRYSRKHRPITRSCGPHRIAIGLYDRTGDGEALTRRRRVELDIAGAATEVPELVGERAADLVLVNDDDLTYAKIRLDDRSLRTLVGSISDLADPLAAALCWASAWDMTRDAEMRTRDFLALVSSGAPAITELSVLERILPMTSLAVRRYADPQWRAAGLAQLEDTLRGWLLAAEPGSDHQLAYAKALADVATSQASLGCWPGCSPAPSRSTGSPSTPTCAGSCCTGWSAAALAGPVEIEAELDRDRTDAGERHAESCLAAIPTPRPRPPPGRRSRAGRCRMRRSGRSLRGFRDPDQDELLAPYADRFYDALAGMWQDGASDMAQFFTEVGYPDTVVSQAAIEATDAYIAAASPAPALRTAADRAAGRRRPGAALPQRDAQPG